jgi:hypothetical protein
LCAIAPPILPKPMNAIFVGINCNQTKLNIVDCSASLIGESVFYDNVERHIRAVDGSRNVLFEWARNFLGGDIN